jgi:hypothetical protein
MLRSSTITVALIHFALFWAAKAAPTQYCTQPEKSLIDWTPKSGEIRIFHFKEREVRVTIPPRYNESNVALPMILAYSDKDMSTEEMMFSTVLSEPSMNDEFIIAYLAGVNVSCFP